MIDEPDVQPEPEPAPDPLPELEQAETRSEPTPRPVGHPGRSSGKRARPTVPAWEDVLLGVRSSGGR